MKIATYATLALACVVGVLLVALYGQWWMYIAGVLTALGVIAYSSGPYPLSRHALGEVAVIIFFGIVPVCLTYMLMGGGCSPCRSVSDSWEPMCFWSTITVTGPMTSP